MAATAALVMAGGGGKRIGGELPKQFLKLGDKTILQRSLELFEQQEKVTALYLVLPEEYLKRYKEFIDMAQLSKFRRAVAGGARRQDSVAKGLAAIEEDQAAELVAVHDAVRPFAEPRLIADAITMAAAGGAAILAAPSTNTLKKCDQTGRITSTLDRAMIWNAQTPQVFKLCLLLQAYRSVTEDGKEITDEAQAVERIGRPVELVASPETNFKITTTTDFAFAEWLLAQREKDAQTTPNKNG